MNRISPNHPELGKSSILFQVVFLQPFSKSQENVGKEIYKLTQTGPIYIAASLQCLNKISRERIRTALAEMNNIWLGATPYPKMSQHFLSVGCWLGSPVQCNATVCFSLANIDSNCVWAPLLLFPYSELKAKQGRSNKKQISVYMHMLCTCSVYTCVCVYT